MAKQWEMRTFQRRSLRRLKRTVNWLVEYFEVFIFIAIRFFLKLFPVI